VSGRQAAAFALIVLGTIVAPCAAVAVWARAQVLDTSAYVHTVTPLADSSAIRNAVADRITSVVASEGAAAGVQGQVHSVVESVLASDRFKTLWVDANRLAHRQVVALLEGKGLTEVRGDRVVLDLTPVAQQVYDTLDQQDPADFPPATLPAGALSFEIFKSSNLTTARKAMRWLDRLAIVLPIASLVLLGAAVAVARRRRVALSRAGLGFALGMAALLVLVAVGRREYLNAVDSVVPRGAAADFVDVLLHSLKTEAQIAIFAGVAVGVGAGLAGRRQRPWAAVRVGVVSAACLVVAFWAI
jgi:hypothetical protein